MVESSMELVSRRYAAAPARFAPDLAEELPSLRADKRMIKQILVNLLANAMKFSPGGGTVTVRTRRDGDGLALEISDQGIGMDPRSFGEALKPFHQLDSALSRRFEGMGLGLSLVKLYTDCHDAVLDIHSAPGEGTRVAVRFPADRTWRGRGQD